MPKRRRNVMSTTIAMPADLADALASIDPARMLTHTQRLCAPDFAGRLVGTEGHARASTFLAEQLRQPGWNVTTQEFPITALVLDLTALPTLTQIAADGSVLRIFAHRTEFSEHPH